MNSILADTIFWPGRWDPVLLGAGAALLLVFAVIVLKLLRQQTAFGGGRGPHRQP